MCPGTPFAPRGGLGSRIALFIALAACQAAGCGARVFSDATVIDIIADAPPEPEPEPVAMPEQIELGDKVRFARNSARILSESHPVLDEVATKIKDAPEITKIRIEGHASADGNDDHNLTLSSKRAASVLDYLVAQGVESERLTSEGFGETRPVADNDTAEGREENRRVELHIVERDSGSDEPSAAAP
ncbi:MAG: OmpA family protein [Myxococcota bacterium]